MKKKKPNKTGKFSVSVNFILDLHLLGDSFSFPKNESTALSVVIDILSKSSSIIAPAGMEIRIKPL